MSGEPTIDELDKGIAVVRQNIARRSNRRPRFRAPGMKQGLGNLALKYSVADSAQAWTAMVPP